MSRILTVDYFTPPAVTNRNVDTEPSLPALGSLTIGYGAGGALPFKYHLRDGQASDVGIIKIFISTEAVDGLGDLQQQPVHTFGVDVPDLSAPLRARATTVTGAANDASISWDTYHIVVKQRSFRTL